MNIKFPDLPFLKKKSDGLDAESGEGHSTAKTKAPPALPTISFLGGSIGGLVRNGLVVLAVATGVAGFGIPILFSLETSGTMAEQGKAIATVVAARLTDGVAMRRQLLGGVIASSGLAARLQGADDARLEAEAKAFQPLLGADVQVQLLDPEWNAKSAREESKLSFAEMEMLRAAEKEGAVVPAELHGLKEGGQRIRLATALRTEGEKGPVQAYLIASWPAELISRSLHGIAPEVGTIEVQQTAGGKSWTLANNGLGELGDSGDGVFPVEGAIWRVTYRSAGSAIGFNGLLGIWGLMLAGLIATAAAMLLQLKLLRTGWKVDQANLVNLVNGMVKGRARPPEHPRIAEFELTLQLLQQVAQRGGKGVADEPAPPEIAPIRGEGGAEPVNPLMNPKGAPPPPPASRPVPAKAAAGRVRDTIFRAYDIRGVVDKDLTADAVFQIGRAIGSEAYEKGQQTVIVARDGRESGEGLVAALTRGLMESGRDVLDIGMVPTPVLYYATHTLGSNCGVMVTGSHNPPEYNGLKIVIDGSALSGDAILGLKRRIETGNLLEGKGVRRSQEVLDGYIGRVTADITPARPLKLVVDCGNGVAGVVAPKLLRQLGCEVVELYCNVDGRFPNHHPDPGKPENMRALIAEVRKQKADLGVAFDGDGDRIGLVDSSGKIIWPDRLLMLLARDVLSRQPGADVIYDVKSSRHLAGEILARGGRPVMWKTGHSLIKEKMKQSGALLAGEMSGHIFIKERWYGFDDALYACARLLEVLALEGGTSAELFAGVPEGVSTPEFSVMMAEGAPAAIMQKLGATAKFPGAKLITIDGVRAEFEDGWGLVRCSNTTPSLSFRFEADTPSALERIQGIFREQIKGAAPEVALPF